MISDTSYRHSRGRHLVGQKPLQQCLLVFSLSGFNSQAKSGQAVHQTG